MNAIGFYFVDTGGRLSRRKQKRIVFPYAI